MGGGLFKRISETMNTPFEKCPVCNARYAGKARCHRCRTDLAPLLNVLSQADAHYRRAVSARNRRDFKAMFHHARRSYQLHRGEATRKLLAVAALLNRKFDLALALWRR